MASVITNQVKPTLPISPVSSGAMGTQNISPRDTSDVSARGRRRSRSPENDGHEQDPRGEGNQDGPNGASSNSDGPGPARKRRRSRKGLDKRFECSAEGCGKSYSRAEHLYDLILCNSTTHVLTWNTDIDINSTTTLNKPTTAPFPTAHGHSSEEIFSNDIWTDTRQKAHSLINGIAWPDTWGPLLPLVNHPTSAEITLSITESRSQQTCLTKRRKSQHPALIRLWVMLQQGCTKTDLCLMAWKPTCLQLRVTTIARRSLANLNHLQCRNDLQYQPAIRNTTLCLPLPINMVSQTNKTWHRTLPLSASRTSCL